MMSVSPAHSHRATRPNAPVGIGDAPHAFPGTAGIPTALPRAADGTRTRDLVLTKDALYQLSYSSGICGTGS